jgi:hypothetical protein
MENNDNTNNNDEMLSPLPRSNSNMLREVNTQSLPNKIQINLNMLRENTQYLPPKTVKFPLNILAKIVRYFTPKEYLVMLILFPNLQNKFYNRRESNFLKEYLPFEDSFESDIQKEFNFYIFPDYLKISRVFLFTIGKSRPDFIPPRFRIFLKKTNTLSLQTLRELELRKQDGFSFSKETDVQDIVFNGHLNKVWTNQSDMSFHILTKDISKCSFVEFKQCREFKPKFCDYVTLEKSQVPRWYQILPKRVGFLYSISIGRENNQEILQLRKFYHEVNYIYFQSQTLVENLVAIGEFDEKKNTIQVKYQNSNTWNTIKI